MQLKTHVKAGFAPTHRDVQASGLIQDDADAANQCPSVCRNAGGCTNGQWTTLPGARKSVCGCVFST
jgi:hypothetical protein